MINQDSANALKRAFLALEARIYKIYPLQIDDEHGHTMNGAGRLHWNGKLINDCSVDELVEAAKNIDVLWEVAMTLARNINKDIQQAIALVDKILQKRED